MAYNAGIEATIDRLYSDASVLTSKKMFGGVCYLYRGNMAFGITGHYLIIRLGDATEAENYIQSGAAEPFDMTGKVMKSWIMVDTSNLKTDGDYVVWLEKGLSFAQSLPPKKR